jgi:hypothetical protein
LDTEAFIHKSTQLSNTANLATIDVLPAENQNTVNHKSREMAEAAVLDYLKQTISILILL